MFYEIKFVIVPKIKNLEAIALSTKMFAKRKDEAKEYIESYFVDSTFLLLDILK